jgi:predicted RND superfamily exporter protein
MRVDASGAYAIAAASERAIRADLTSSIFWSIVVMQVVFLLGYRNLLSFLIAFAPVAIGLCVAFGVHALLSTALTPLTAVIGASLVGCGIDYSIYLLSYFEAARTGIAEGGFRIADLKSARSTMEEALGSLAVPLTAACATSVVGFVAVAFSSVHALQDFAVLGALGLSLALAGVVWVLPAMLMVASRVGRVAQAGPRAQMGGAIRAICARPRVFVGVCLLLCVVAGVAVVLRPVQFETNLNVMHPSPNRPLETERAIGRTFGATDTMLIYIEAGAQRELIATAYRVQDALGTPALADAGISGSTGLPALLPDPRIADGRTQKLAGIDVGRVLADFDGAVAQSSFDPAAFGPYKDFLRQLLTNAASPTLESLAKYPAAAAMLLSRNSARPAAMTLVTFGHSLQDARARDAAVEGVRGALANIPGVTLTGLTVVGYDIEHAVRKDLPVIIGVASVAVILILIPALRSLRDGCLACIPVLFGILVLLGYMGATGERLNLANTVAVPLLIGVGIDYGIFLVTMAQQSRREGREGLLRRFAASFHAILLTSMTSIIGFGSLAFTSTPAIQSMGRVVALGIAACVVGALLFLAPLLVSLAPSAADEPRR